MITHEQLLKRLHYNPDTGIFTSLRRNKIIGHIFKGYVIIHIFNKSYLAHRLAWFYMTGSWPKEQLDHIDGIKINNEFNNLRESNMRLNKQNIRQATKGNKLGILGVYKRETGKYCATININGRSKNLGSFNTAGEAHEVYLEAKRKYHEGCTI